MVQKYVSDKKIFWISVVIVIGGLLSPTIIVSEGSEIFKIFASYFKAFFDVIHVSLFNLEKNFALEIPFDNNGSFLNYNVLNAFLYLLLLLGAILFKTSKSKETRLLRFIFSIVFLGKLLNLVLAIFFFFVYLENSVGVYYLYTFLNFVVIIAHLVLSFAVLKYFESQKTLDSVTKQYGERESVVFVESSNWTRVFHHLMDNFIMVLVLSPMFVIGRIPSVQNFLNSISDVIGDRPAVILIIAILRILYYFTFEATLGITAAKLLAETRVIDEDGNKPSAGKIALRTLLRIVPFEAFTFLASAGLHDRSSETYVVNEKRTGVKGTRYFLIFPIVLLLGLAIWFAIDKYQDVQSHKIYEAEKKQNNEAFFEKVQAISTNDMVQLKAINYDHEGIFLKAEKMEDDAINFVILDTEKDYKPFFGDRYSPYLAQRFIEKIYEIEKANPETIRLSKAALLEANETAEKGYYEQKKGLSVLGKQFEIVEIESYFGPRLFLSFSERNSERCTVTLQNAGWPVELISVTKFKLDYGELPVTLNRNAYNSVVLSGEKTDTFDFTIKVKDTLNRVYAYKIAKQEHLQPVIKRMK